MTAKGEPPQGYIRFKTALFEQILRQNAMVGVSLTMAFFLVLPLGEGGPPQAVDEGYNVSFRREYVVISATICRNTGCHRSLRDLRNDSILLLYAYSLEASRYRNSTPPAG